MDQATKLALLGLIRCAMWLLMLFLFVKATVALAPVVWFMGKLFGWW